MDQRVLAKPPPLQRRRFRGAHDDDGLTFVSGIDARRKTTEGDAQLDAVEHGDEAEEPRRRFRRERSQ